jgi:outer membrane protein OmpA-like peptidoglycan-associated protein
MIAVGGGDTIATYPNATITVAGHTDHVGTEIDNARLSRRAPVLRKTKTRRLRPVS